MNGQPWNLRGRIFDIQHFCVNDGPGIRTTVFLKGCYLRCLWCHNPESYESALALSYHSASCADCGECVNLCKAGAQVFRGEKHQFDRASCTGCGECLKVCCYGAMKQVGREADTDAILREVLLDRAYYQQGQGGGITVSGGEPFYQAPFLQELLRKAKINGLHTCVETSGYAAREALESVITDTDLFLFDLKGARRQYKALTGVLPERIYENLRWLLAQKSRMVIRIPLVPDLNDTDEFFEELGELAAIYPAIEAFEIMPYHNMGSGKAVEIGGQPLLAKRESATQKQQQDWLERLHSRKVPAAVNYFGSVK